MHIEGGFLVINKKVLIAAVLALVVSVSAGCVNVSKPTVPGGTNITNPGENQNGSQYDEAKQEEIMKEYENIINKEYGISEHVSFINENIKYLSSDNASKLILKLEEMQKEYRIKLEDKYYTSNIQNKLDEIVRPDYDLSKINVENIMDEKAKKLLGETINLGYKIESTEGAFFPIIDYSFYEKYSAYATPDIKDYISIMVEESSKIPAKDAGLVISWDEILKRALNQEKFLAEHKDSVKFEDIKALYKEYVTFAVYGLDNTPLFIYGAKKMNDDAKEAYEKVIAKNGKLSQALKEYYGIIEKNGFKLNDNVENFRDDLIKNMKYLP